MTIEELLQWVTSRNSVVKNSQELCADVRRDTGIPRRIEPENASAPAPVFSPIFAVVVVVEFVNIDFLIF